MLACGEWNRYRRADLSGCAPPAGSKTYSIWAVCFVWMQRAEDTVTAEEWFPWGQHRIDLYKHRTRLPALKRRRHPARRKTIGKERGMLWESDYALSATEQCDPRWCPYDSWRRREVAPIHLAPCSSLQHWRSRPWRNPAMSCNEKCQGTAMLRLQGAASVPSPQQCRPHSELPTAAFRVP